MKISGIQVFSAYDREGMEKTHEMRANAIVAGSKASIAIVFEFDRCSYHMDGG